MISEMVCALALVILVYILFQDQSAIPILIRRSIPRGSRLRHK